MNISLTNVISIITILGAIGGLIVFVWRACLGVVDRVEKSKQRAIDYAHEKSRELEREKTNLLKELDSQKQRYVQKLVDTVREQMGKVADKVDKLSSKFVRIDEKLNANAKSEKNNLEKIENFIDSTNKRFEIIKKEFIIYSGGNTKE